MKCKRSSDGHVHDQHTLQVMRQQAMKAVRSGQTASSVAAAFGVNTRSVFRWLAAYVNGGQDALLAKPVPGRPPKLTPDQMAWITRTVRENTPQQLKFAFGWWTLKLICDLIKREIFRKISKAVAFCLLVFLLGFNDSSVPSSSGPAKHAGRYLPKEGKIKSPSPQFP